MSGVREQVQETEELEPGEGQDGASADVDARARRAGWVPLEEFRGDPARWISAERFLQVAEENFPKAKERNRSLDAKLRRVEQQNAALIEGLNELRADAAKNQQRAYERARQDLLTQQQQAVQTGDTATYNHLAQELQRVEAEKPKPVPDRVEAPPTEDVQELRQWVAGKPWWQKNQALTQMVTAMHANYMALNPSMSQMEGLREVEAMLADRFPAELGKPKTARQKAALAQGEEEELEPEEPAPSRNSRRETPSNVGGSTFSGAAPRRGGKPVKISDLPREEQADARKAFEKYKGLMANAKNPFTEEEYVRNYLDQ